MSPRPPRQRSRSRPKRQAVAGAPVGVTPDVLAQHTRNFPGQTGFPVRDFTFGLRDIADRDGTTAKRRARGQRTGR